ncbi:head-tail adaptor protein [Chromobacterium violaceum]|uniref:phage head completion protein n=1 Tax=Chromobacterium violaceum TaxID=536 RepID=UPI0005BE02B5|nr:head-tail adaptor protein [Chromobacterium violaceum]
MNASMLNNRIRLSQPIKSRQPSGAVREGWGEPKPVHAKVDYLGARTYTAALAEQTGCSVRATIRRRAVAQGWRAWVDGLPLKVKTIEPHQDRSYLVLMLRTDDGNG